MRSGLGWELWEKHNGTASNIHIGHNITNSTINQSDLSTNALNSPIITPANTHNRQSIIVGILRVISENIIKTIITVIVGLIAVYLGFKL